MHECPFSVLYLLISADQLDFRPLSFLEFIEITLGKNVTRLPHFLPQVSFLLSHAFRDHILDDILDKTQFK